MNKDQNKAKFIYNPTKELQIGDLSTFCKSFLYKSYSYKTTNIDLHLFLNFLYLAQDFSLDTCSIRVS